LRSNQEIVERNIPLHLVWRMPAREAIKR